MEKNKSIFCRVNKKFFFCFFDFLFLLLLRGTVVNCLLTCCKDNICRIWCETMQQDESSVYTNDPTMIRTQRKRQNEHLDKSVQKLYKMR
jgi:hypothetical protein